MRRPRLGRSAVLVLLALSFQGAGIAQEDRSDPLLWPEAERAFLQDGPGLLLSPEERERLVGLGPAERPAWIQGWLGRAPELAQAIERRRRLAAAEVSSPLDARWQLLFLQGRPASRWVVDCAAFQPLEVWTYGAGKAARDLVLFQPAAGEPFRLWLPADSKRALYTAQMEVWLEQWRTSGLGGKRIDKRFCADAKRMDQVTGLSGLGDRPSGRPRQEEAAADGGTGGSLEDRVARLEGPADLAAWAREAAATELPQAPPALEVGAAELDFPRRQGQRLVARLLLTLPAVAGKPWLPGDRPLARLVAEGVLEAGGRTFDDFRVRFQAPPPLAGEPLPLLLERPLRPGQSFLLRLRLKDEASGAEARLARGFRVPAEPVDLLAGAAEPPPPAASASKPPRRGILGREELLLVPPPDEVILGVWRAETAVASPRIARVVFLVDGEPQMTRSRPPFSAEVRLAPVPREQVVRAEGYDAQGILVAADQVVLNPARGAFRVRITDPPRGGGAQGRVAARAEVVVPEEHAVSSVEFRLGDRVVATLASPPWRCELDVPPGSGLAYLTVTALLDDGRRAEDVRILRAPANLEQVDVQLVEVYVTVADGSGQPVRGLGAADFTVREAGRPQKIASVEPVENLPLHVGIALDTSFSMASAIVEAQRAAVGFLRDVLRPQDRCFAMSFAARPELLMPPVDDVEALALALEGARSYGRTALHDGVVAALHLLREERGQRALILLTDGDDTASHTPWEQVLEYAGRSGVALYAIGLDISPLTGAAVRSKLAELAQASGGRAFFVARADELEGVYDQIEEELRSRYLLVYEADRPAEEGGLRRAEVRAGRGLRARTARVYDP